MKKRSVFSIIVLIIFLLLFLPIPKASYDDGGTREFDALGYKIVVWNRIVDEEEQEDIGIYHHTSLYWFPDNQKDIGELWEMELASR